MFRIEPCGNVHPRRERDRLLGRGRIVVVDVATGDATPVAEGRAAIWLDDHSLLVDACRRISVI